MPTIQVSPGAALELQTIADTLGKSRKVIVVTGAGISTNCGIPDFRSEDGLYSLIQAQYDNALQNPPWQDSDSFEIDERPKKKRKTWFYEVVAPDGEVVGVVDDVENPTEPKRSSRVSSRSRSSSTKNSRSSSPTADSTDASSISGPSSIESDPLIHAILPAEPSGSRRTSRRTALPSEKPQAEVEFKNPPFKRHTSDTNNSITSPTTKPPASNSRPPSRANSAGRKSVNTSLSTNSTRKPLPLTRTQFLQRQESSILSNSEDDEPSSTQSSQFSRASLPNLKGRDLFDSMVWSDPFTTSIFYMFISSLRQKIQNEVQHTTEAHQFIRVLRDGGRLVRNYTQNIDSLEEREGLCTDLTLGPGNRARFSSKIQRETRPDRVPSESPHSGGVECVLLHGSLVALRCGLCTKLSSWDEAGRESATLSGQAPDCPSCTEYNAKRTGDGRRGLAVGRLRPDIVLYGEEHPHANLVSPIVTHDLGLGPDVLLIMGTSLRVHGLKVLIKEFAKAVHTRGGKVVFVNRTKPSESTWGDVIDYWVEWDCDSWVVDLKERRRDLWLPQGSMPEKGKDSTSAKPSASQPVKSRNRPWCTRDDRLNGVYLTFKILDSLRDLPDQDGNIAERRLYFPKPARASKSEGTIAEVPPPKKPSRKSEPIKKLFETTKKPNTKSKKRKSEPPIIHNDKVNVSQHVASVWQNLRNLHPSLPEAAPDISPAILLVKCQNIPTTEQKFAFNAESNHIPNLKWGEFGRIEGGKFSEWGTGQINLITHPPSGACIPVHTPRTEVRKPNAHSYGTRQSRAYSTSAINDQLAPAEPLRASKRAPEPKFHEKENQIPTPPTTDPMTPSSSRIKRVGRISAILSSPEQSTEDEWHDAAEVMT